MKKSNNIDEFINWCHLSALEIKENKSLSDKFLNADF